MKMMTEAVAQERIIGLRDSAAQGRLVRTLEAAERPGRGPARSRNLLRRRHRPCPA